MKVSATLLAVACGLIAAHGDLPIPRIVGGGKLFSDLRARHIADPARERAVEHIHDQKQAKTHKRENTSGQCGKGYGSCAVGYCCSAEGYDLPTRSSSKITQCRPQLLSPAQMVRKGVGLLHLTRLPNQLRTSLRRGTSPVSSCLQIL